MTLYCHNDEFGLSCADIEARFPDTSFVLDQPIVGFPGVEPYDPTPPPTYNFLSEELREVAPVNGLQQWEIVALPAEQVEANLANLAMRERARRDFLLQASDWTQLGDAPVDAAAWAAYRQALRDVTQQPGFPQTIAWPVSPGGTVSYNPSSTPHIG